MKNSQRGSTFQSGMNKHALPILETRENKYSNRRFECEHVFAELTALCPITLLPDVYTLRLVYEPARKLVELKSMKLYLVAFRGLEILHEELANRILDDFIGKVKPRWVRIQLTVNNRGGILTTIRRDWDRRLGDRISERLAKGRDT